MKKEKQKTENSKRREDTGGHQAKAESGSINVGLIKRERGRSGIFVLISVKGHKRN